jgi:phosphoglycolate phosphatase-like HAD superfamily hydrolase
MHVIFFDIDGTLINTGGSGMESLRRAYLDLFDCPPPEHIPTAGRTDRGIARDLFFAQRVEDSAENWMRFRTAYLWHLREQLPRRPGCVLPGVGRMLEQLAARQDIALGLLTGNVAEGARLKLKYFGLDHHFTFGGYGERAPERNAVAEEALAAARGALDGAVHPNRVWVLGDTPLDIQCARHIGAKAVAVATGMHDKRELARARPDVLLDDFCQAAEFWRQLDEATAA